MKSLLVFYIFLLVCCQLQLVFSAEWSQLQNYLKQFPYSNEQQTAFLNNTSGCLRSHIYNREGRGSPPRMCRRIALNYIKEIPFSEPLQVTAERSCEYSLRKISSILFRKSNIVVIKVAISQETCNKNVILKVQGGSSLRVQLAVAHDKVDCRLHHIQRDEYTHTCRLRISDHTDDLHNPLSRCNTLCGISVRALLDYENFEAYHERAGEGYGLGRLVVNETVEHIQLLIPPQLTGSTNSNSESSVCCPLRALPILGVSAVANYDSNGDAYPTPASSSSGLASAAGSLNPLSISKVQDLLTAQYAGVYFIGSSHMRYLWDVLAVRHLNGSALLQSLPQHHSDAVLGNTWFVNNYFSMELPSLVEEICSPDSAYAPNTEAQGYDVRKMLAFVVQTGSWDLDYNPVRSLVEYPQSSSEVVSLMHKLAAEGVNCMGHSTRLVWLTAPPIPECASASTTAASEAAVKVTSQSGVVHREKTSCFDKGYRNNYAIAAANQHFLQAITGVPHLPSSSIKAQTTQVENGFYSRIWKQLNGKKRTSQQVAAGLADSHSNHSSHMPPPLPRNTQLRVLDAFSLLYPYRQTHVCGLHYLCCKHTPKDKSIDLLVTPGGELLLQQLLLTLLAE